MAFVLSSGINNYRLDRRNLMEKPGHFERLLVIAATSSLLAGLPIDWWRTRAETLDEGNVKMVAVQLALMLFGVLRIAGRLDDVIRALKLEITVFLFGGLALASLFWSADIGETIRQAIVLLAIAFYGLYLVLRFELREILRLLAFTFTINAVCSFVFVFQYPAYGLTPSTGQWTGVFTQKNALGFAAAIAMPALIAAARTTPRWRFLFYGGALAHAALLLFSESKTMYVAGYGSLVLMLVFRFFRGRKTLRGAVVTSLVGSSVFAIAFATANIGLLARWLDKDVSLTGRIPLWTDLIPVALERVALGHGYRAAFGGYFSPVHEVWIRHNWEPPHAHNALFHIWLELGLIGVVLFVIGFFRAIKRATHGVNLVPNAVGIWPLTFLSTSLLISISESGITATEIGWLMYVCTVLSVSLWFRNGQLAEAGLLPGQGPIEPSYEERFGSRGTELVSSNIR